MEYNCFERLKFEEMSKRVGDRRLAFNLLMPDLEKFNSPDYNSPDSIVMASFFFVDVVIIHAFMGLGLQPLEAWDMVRKTWPYIIFGGLRIGYLFLNRKKRGLNKIRIGSGNPGGIFFWMFLFLIGFGLGLSVMQTSGLVHRIFLGLFLVFGVILIGLVWLTEKAYLTYDQGMDRHRWLVAQILQEEVRLVAQVHHDLGEEVRYQHRLYPVPLWPDEKIDQLIKMSWQRKRSVRITYIYITIITILILFPASMAVTEFSQVNGVLLPFAKERTELYPQILELSLIILFIVTVFVFCQGIPINSIPLALLFHFLFVTAGTDSMINLLLIGYAVIIWKGAVDYFKNDHKDIVERYLKYIRLLR